MIRDNVWSNLLAFFSMVVLINVSENAWGAEPPVPIGVLAAVDYIGREHDRFHRNFIIFDDHCSGGCHFFPEGWMGDLVPGKPVPKWVAGIFDERWALRPAEGNHCLRIHYPAELAMNGPHGWVACEWKMPETVRNSYSPYDLSRFVFPGEQAKLVWLVRGEKGTEQAEFKAFSMDGPVNPTILGMAWKEYSLPLMEGDLAKPIDKCFVWSTNKVQNPKGSTFFLDNIRIEFGPQGTARRLAEPRFVRSYYADAGNFPDKHFRNVCYSYDQALAISALVATGTKKDRDRAGLIADALVYAVANDRYFTDSRIRNAYLCGDLAGLGKDGLIGSTRLPGWWDFEEKHWCDDEYFTGSDCGNTCWVIIGLLNYWQAIGKPEKSKYLDVAVRLGQWIDKRSFDENGAGGFTGGQEGFDRKQTSAPWKSTEHAIDLYAAYTRLAAATNNARFRKLAAHSEKFVDAMWNAADNHLHTGTNPDGKTPNLKPIPLDAQVWALLAFRNAKKFGPAVAWASKNCRVNIDSEHFGFDFNEDRDGVWWEGTGQMVLAFRMLRQNADADACLKTLRAKGVVAKPHPAHGAIYTAHKDGLTTGFQKAWGNWLYYRRPHIGATCWYIFSELNWNPYWGEPIVSAK